MSDIHDHLRSFSLKEGFGIGVSSAPAQIEGGQIQHSWNAWADRGLILDKTSPRRATDHFNRWQEDTELLNKLKIKFYRMGIEWARIEPREGEYDEQAIEIYRDELKLLKKNDVQIILTLHHFSNPVWFERIGAFARKENSRYFLRYVTKAVEYFGDLVSEYLTINEPNVYAYFGYYTGAWPPGMKSLAQMEKVMTNLCNCHIQAYEHIHRIRREMGYEDTKVSFAHHMRIFEPHNPNNPLDKLGSALSERIFQGAVGKAFMTGRFTWPLRNTMHLPEGQYVDFLALNYYTRSQIKGLRECQPEGVAVNDLGWEIYSEGLIRTAKAMYDILPLPIYVTENGTCDNHDAYRCLYIYEHLRTISESDLPFERFCHWCFCDNFEWLEGESARFGIVKIDYETQKRTIKKSGRFFADLIKNNGVTDEMIDKYLKNQTYPRR